ncbi:hypothetical protein WL50_23075 [Burkholderia ubonensis]|uniref:DUF5677 domain-containing protein n=1 Tax=Burkholderia ubonensis TaxID=101571 RepID=UPI0007538102|nr:DUF5677 domain-containing protein [Burkholderia ubonensis]KWC32677.1 hypothetical protein WL50_23075 [Burkholderia ubonensis]
MDETDEVSVWLAHSEKVYGIASEILSECEIPVGPEGAADPKVVAATLLIRTMSNFKGATLLAKQGFVVEARILTRCCIENLLWLGQVLALGDSFIKEMASDDDKSRSLRAAFALDVATTEDTKDRLRKAIDEIARRYPTKPKLLNPKGVAKGSVIESSYLQYSQLSADAAHPSLTALIRYIGRDNTVGTRDIDMSPVPRPSELAQTVYWACIALTGASVAFNQLAGPTTAGRALSALADEFETLRERTGVR